jgi:hypothetical protein
VDHSVNQGCHHGTSLHFVHHLSRNDALGDQEIVEKLLGKRKFQRRISLARLAAVPEKLMRPLQGKKTPWLSFKKVFP